MKLCLVFAPYALALLSIFSCSETRAQTKPSVESTSVQQLARLIERNLKRDQFDRQTSIRLGFRLTKAGEVYSITCLSPTHNANALRASVRALLAGMPFSNTPDLNCPERVLECRIESTSTVPEINVTCVKSETVDVVTSLDRVPFGGKSERDEEVLPCWMMTRLTLLCSLLSAYPDSAEVKSAIAPLLAHMNLHQNSANDWRCLGDSLTPRFMIKPKPNELIVQSCKASIAAYFEAWRLGHDQASLNALERSYDMKMALDLLAPQVGPIGNDTAAVLMDQPNIAQNPLFLAMRSKPEVSSRFYGESKKKVGMHPRMRIAKQLRPRKDTADWRTVLKWFPPDTETVITAPGPFKLEPAMDPDNPKFLNETIVNDLRTSLLGLPVSTYDKCKGLLTQSNIMLAIRGSRAFKAPYGLGPGTYEGADVIVFAPESTKEREQIIRILREECEIPISCFGLEVLMFDQIPIDENQTNAQYVCSPCDGVLLVSSGLSYLQEMLQRLRREQADRALPDTLIEWNEVNTLADIWAIRHFNHARMPFDRSALQMLEPTGPDEQLDLKFLLDKKAVATTFSCKTDGQVRMNYLSSSKRALKLKADYLRAGIEKHRGKKHEFSDLRAYPDRQMQLEVTLQNRKVEMTGKPNAAFSVGVLLLLLDSCGHMVNL